MCRRLDCTGMCKRLDCTGMCRRLDCTGMYRRLDCTRNEIKKKNYLQNINIYNIISYN